MNLDLDTLKEMISSTISELNEPAASSEIENAAEDAAEDAVKATEQAAQAAKEASIEASIEAGLESEDSSESDLSLTKESFEITKGRLRQIIAEELISAKKQGIL
jgi:putative cell wall-binding protein